MDEKTIFPRLMKNWIKLFCSSFSDTICFGIALIGLAVTLGAMFQILCNIFTKYLKVF